MNRSAHAVKIKAAASTVVNALVVVGQLIYKGLVALGTFLVNLAQAIADWGMKPSAWNAGFAVAQGVASAFRELAVTPSTGRYSNERGLIAPRFRHLQRGDEPIPSPGTHGPAGP